MAIIQKAGAIILGQTDASLVALLFRSKQGDWSFPKGHVDAGESVAETTRREVMEETGLNVRLISELPPMNYDHPNGDHIVVHMFLMQSESDDALKTEFDGDKIVWVNFNTVTEKLSYDNSKQYYTSVIGKIEKNIKELQLKTR